MSAVPIWACDSTFKGPPKSRQWCPVLMAASFSVGTDAQEQVDRWTNRGPSYRNIVFTLQRDGNLTHATAMDGHWGYHANNRSQWPQRQMLCDSTYERGWESLEAERQRETVVPGSHPERGMGSQCSVRMEFGVAGCRVLEMDGGDSCTTFWMCLTPPNCTLRTAKMMKFMEYLV